MRYSRSHEVALMYVNKVCCLLMSKQSIAPLVKHASVKVLKYVCVEKAKNRHLHRTAKLVVLEIYLIVCIIL